VRLLAPLPSHICLREHELHLGSAGAECEGGSAQSLDSDSLRKGCMAVPCGGRARLQRGQKPPWTPCPRSPELHLLNGTRVAGRTHTVRSHRRQHELGAMAVRGQTTSPRALGHGRVPAAWEHVADVDR
jgi:hypothetical protein